MSSEDGLQKWIESANAWIADQGDEDEGPVSDATMSNDG